MSVATDISLLGRVYLVVDFLSSDLVCFDPWYVSIALPFAYEMIWGFLALGIVKFRVGP